MINVKLSDEDKKKAVEDLKSLNRVVETLEKAVEEIRAIGDVVKERLIDNRIEEETVVYIRGERLR